VAVTILSGDSYYSRASQWPVKAALRRDVASKAAFSRDLPSLSENHTAFSPTCRNTVWFCTVGRNPRALLGAQSLRSGAPNGMFRRIHITPVALAAHSTIKGCLKKEAPQPTAPGQADVCRTVRFPDRLRKKPVGKPDGRQ